MGLFLALPIGLVCGFGPIFLTLWVEQDIPQLYLLTWILVGHLCINLAVLPIFSVQLAFNKVKVPGVVTLILGCIDVVFAIVIVKHTHLGMYGIGLAGAIVLTIKNLIFTPWYTAKILNKDIGIYMKPVVFGVFATLVLALLSFFVASFFEIESWLGLIISSSFISIVYGVWMLYGVMNIRERGVILFFTKKRRVENGYN